MEGKNTETQYVEVGDYDDDFTNYELKDRKHDAGRTQFKNKNYIKRTPLHLITDKTEIPAEPQEKHDKPNESKFNKEYQAIEDEIAKHKKNLEELYEEKKREKTGNNPDYKKVLDRIDEINKKTKELNEIVEAKNAELVKPLAEEQSLKLEKEKLEKELTFKSFEKATAEVLFIQEQLGFHELSNTEEKKLMEKKKKIEEQLPRLQHLEKVRNNLKKIRDQNKAPFEALKKLKHELYTLREERKTEYSKRDVYKSNIKSVNETVNQLEEKIKSLKETNRELAKKRNELERDFNDKWYKWEVYEEEMTYIREATKKKNDFIKREEKKKKKEEKLAKKDGNTGEVEINTVSTGETLEVLDCKALINYFNSLTKTSDTKEVVQETKDVLSDKIKEDLNKGLVSIVDREKINNDQLLGIEGKSKKKTKGPKVSKREQKSLNTDLLILDIEINQQIDRIGLKPIAKKSQIEAFIKTLEDRLEELKKQAAEEVARREQAKAEALKKASDVESQEVNA